jgi:hypothetical protein
MYAQLIFILGLAIALWWINICQPRHTRRARPCRVNPPPKPGTLYIPHPYPRDTHTSDARNRVYDTDGSRF